MSSIISCRGKFVWKYGGGSDDSFLGLFSIPEATGVGKVLNVSFDPDNTDENDEFSWTKVNSESEEVHGEVLIIEPQEIERIKEYVKKKTPKPNILQRLTKNHPKPDSLTDMLACVLEHLSESETNEFIFVW